VHSHYSLLNALPKIKDLVAGAKDSSMDAIALTDNGNLYGAIEFYQACKKEDIKPIIGVDAYVAIRSRKDKEARIDNRRTRLVLLAKNYDGYVNLIKLVTDSNLEGFYYKPRIDKETIEKWNTDLICISPFFNSEISNALKSDDTEKAEELCKFYEKVYGKENFYLEITHHPELEGAMTLKEKIINFAKDKGYQLVAAQDVYYMKPEDRAARKTLMSVQQSFGADSYMDENEDFSFIDQKTANKYFEDTPEALENTQKIVDQCNFEITLGVWKFPKLEIENGNTPDEELRRLAYEGVKWRRMELTDEVKERIEYELDVIQTKGYSNYFLAVGDLLRFAKENGIQSNTRGSAAGSLVSYLIGITIVDPIAMRLPFERFLNPERPSAPDVDMDFADARRDEVIEYSREKYGKDHVAQIGTFGTMLARGSVRDTARAMGFDYQVGDQIAKLIPMGAQGFPMTIDRALDEEKELKDLYKKDADSKTVIDMARKIEGCARHIGVHAAGVVISPDPLTEDVPLQWDPKGEGKLITQYDMHAVGEDGVGLLKFDFLGLKNLTIMANTIKFAKKVLGEEIDIDHVPLDDKATYDMLTRGETAATFQLNGSGMTRFLKELKPTNVDDINAMVALYRPGPLAFIPDYIERKNNPKKVKYIDDRFEEILGPTFGILIYQDDVMLIAVKFAGYSWLEADKFRKAMGKKIPEIMAEQKEKFTKGCLEIGGLNESQTKELWDNIETFAAYGFNKAHAASYGRIAYLTSYLKANYPVLYMAAVLTADQGDVEKVAEMVNECKRMEIEVLPPDVNESFEDFATVGKEKKIRFGLTTIKNFGEGVAHEVVEERKVNGPYKSLEDFLTRLRGKALNKRSLEALMASGALDRFGERGQMIANLENIIEFRKELSSGSADQGSLFGEAESTGLKLEDAPPITDEQRLAWEKELLGLYISGNPLDKFKSKLEKASPIHKILEKPMEGANTIVAGIVSDVRVIKTKKGHDMAFIKIADYNDTIEAVVFPKIMEKYRDLMEVDACIVMKGKISARNGEVGLIMEQGKRLVNAEA
jgi:DNA polymerase-3 subunit alpha